MKFDPWTFLFQIINFSVLLLILKHVLYQPVREIMEKRRALAVKTRQETDNALRAAEELQAKNQQEMQSLQAQRTQMLEEMKAEVGQQRQKLLAEADNEVQRQIDKQRALFAAEKARQATEIREEALATVTSFAANILKGIADTDLHRALYRRMLDELERIGRELGDEAGTGDVLNVEVSSAYPLSKELESSLQERLESATGCRAILRIRTDQELLAGVKILVGDHCYDASLSGQLDDFVTEIRKEP